MVAVTKNLGLVAASLLLLLAGSALAARPVERSLTASPTCPSPQQCTLKPYDSSILSIKILGFLKPQVITDYCVKFVSDLYVSTWIQVNSLQTSLLSLTLKLNLLVNADITLNVFGEELIQIDATLRECNYLDVQLKVDIDGTKKYLYRVVSKDGKYKGLVLVFSKCGHTHVAHAHCPSEYYDALEGYFIESLLSYVIKLVDGLLCVVGTLLGGILGR